MTAPPISIAEGDELPPLELAPDLHHVMRFAAVTWDFPAFFYDEGAAAAMKMPGRLVPAPLKLALLDHALERWLDGRGFVRNVRAAHRRPDVQGDPIVIAGTVARVYEEDGATRADIDLAIINKRGEPSVRAFATVQLYN